MNGGSRVHNNAAIHSKSIVDFTWVHGAQRTQKEGGFGMRYHKTIVDTARLASLINVAQRALDFGAAKSHIVIETEKAIVNYVAKLGTGLRPDLRPSRDLQKTLTQPLHAQMKDWLWRNADEPTRQRLNLLKTPHATAWLSCRELL